MLKQCCRCIGCWSYDCAADGCTIVCYNYAYGIGCNCWGDPC